MKKRVISYKNLPSRIPVYQAMVAYLMMDKFNAAGWVWGVVGTIFTIVIISSIIGLFNQIEVDVL
jgi:hypothetical protein